MTAIEPLPWRHHFVPAFYLRRWANKDGKLVEFSKPYGDQVKAKRRHPEETGFDAHVYNVRTDSGDIVLCLENDFFKELDTLASDALRLIEDDFHKTSSNYKLRSAWSRFILSMISRHPEDVTEMGNRWLDRMLDVSDKFQIEYSAERSPTDPGEFREWIAGLEKSEHARHALELQAEMIDSPVLGTILNDMEWSVIETTGAAHPLLTSDRPVSRVGALTSRDALIVLPIGPSRFFVATNDARHGRSIRQLGASGKVRDLNRETVQRAVRFVYGPDDAQLVFVQRHMGTFQLPSRFVGAPSHASRRSAR
ncbi:MULTISPECIES: DUF4238 domain-containing protein [unclassified Chelatococcus]|uniref:DUF4238 domain-containing protein n=1 Tax=unclassified Chelatococcus TaxID=2638111 RepID=UPI001BCF9191|nr:MULTISPECIES: DUF4238 domain-containing protein [unclassified Chelatococcus]MBS7698691.1 DUF4238 domain-containing protein [Chelatococcus sp. YT9]MBX3554727.1 DUF4238 domain-containing protein [Chelatococcus sp.]